MDHQEKIIDESRQGEILKTADNETRLIELKQYLSDFADTLDCDYAQLAYNIYIGDLMANNNDPKQI